VATKIRGPARNNLYFFHFITDSYPYQGGAKKSAVLGDKKVYASAQFSDESPISWICSVGAREEGLETENCAEPKKNRFLAILSG
jgi:hypothetical protein